MLCFCQINLNCVHRVRSMATAVWFPLTSWKKCLMMWRCIWLILRPTTPRKSLPTGPLPTHPPLSRRANGYIIIAALSARPCVHPSSVLSLDFRLLLPPPAVCVLFIVCVCPCGDSGDSSYKLTTPLPVLLPSGPLEKRDKNPIKHLSESQKRNKQSLTRTERRFADHFFCM